MKLSTLVDPQFQAALRKLAAQELPLKVAFAIKGIVKRVNDELKTYDEVRQEALKRLGNKNEDGSLSLNDTGNVQLSDENAQAFVVELNALLATDVEVGSVKVADLGDKLTLSANDLIALEDLAV